MQLICILLNHILKTGLLYLFKQVGREGLIFIVSSLGRGVLIDLTKCTKTKLTAFHQYFTPLQFNVLKSRGGFTSSNFGQTRRTQG